MRVLLIPSWHKPWTQFVSMTVLGTLLEMPHVSEVAVRCADKTFKEYSDYYSPFSRKLKKENEKSLYDVGVLAGFGHSFWWGTPFELKEGKENRGPAVEKLIFWDGEPQWSYKYPKKYIDLHLGHMGNKKAYKEAGIELPEMWNAYEHYRDLDEDMVFLPHPINEKVFMKAPNLVRKTKAMVETRLDQFFSGYTKPTYEYPHADILMSAADEIGRENLREKKGQKNTQEFRRNEGLVMRSFEAPFRGDKILYGNFWEYNPRAMLLLESNDWKYLGSYHWSETRDIFKNADVVLQFCRDVKRENCRSIYSERVLHTILTDGLLATDSMTLDDAVLGFVHGETCIRFDQGDSADVLVDKVEEGLQNKKSIVENAKKKIVPGLDVKFWAPTLEAIIETEVMKK